MAFNDTLYVTKAIEHISSVPPTKLVQSYYSCVMSEWQAFYAASGLSASNTQLYVGVAMIVYMYLSVYIFQKFEIGKGKIRWKVVKLKEAELKKKHVGEFVEALQRDMKDGYMVSCVILSILFVLA